MSDFLVGSIVIAVIGFGVLALLYFEQRANKARPAQIVERFRTAQLAQCKLQGNSGGVRYRYPLTVMPTAQTLAALEQAVREIRLLIQRRGFDATNKFVQPGALTFYLIPEEIKSLETKTPSIIQPVDCSQYLAPYCLLEGDPEHRLLTVNPDFTFNEHGEVAHQGVQARTVAGRGEHQTFLTDNQILCVVLPAEQNTVESFNLVKDAAYNEAEHLVAAIFDPVVYQSGEDPNHVHRIFHD